MSTDNRADAARALEQAWSYLSQGQRKAAREFALRAAELEPHAEGPWLVLAALATPEESLAYLQKVLEINSDNQRARQGLEWARDRIQIRDEILASNAARTIANIEPEVYLGAQTPKAQDFNQLERDLIARGYGSPLSDETRPVPLAPRAGVQSQAAVEKKEHTQPVKIKPPVAKPAAKRKPYPAKPASSRSRLKIAAGLLSGMVVCLVLSAGLAIPFSGVLFPSFASSESSMELMPSIPGYSLISDLMGVGGTPQPVDKAAESSVAQETTQAEFIVATPTPQATITYAPSFTPAATITPLTSPTPSVTSTPVETSTLPPTVVAIPVQPPKNQSEAAPAASDDFTGRWIDVDLANQKAYAMEDDAVVREFTISSGISSHPTVTGQFHVYLKYRYDDMVGPGYNLKDVPWVMYFYKGYGLHGTYWHNNFGHPMSHGCVNMRTDEAEWLYHFAPMGTLVNVH